MITHNRIPQTLLPASIVAIALMAAVLLFPAVNSASSEPGEPAPSKQKEHHNRLMNESSPYLLQHATNPVNWYPWNEEAFETALRIESRVSSTSAYPVMMLGWTRGDAEKMIAIDFNHFF